LISIILLITMIEYLKNFALEWRARADSIIMSFLG